MKNNFTLKIPGKLKLLKKLTAVLFLSSSLTVFAQQENKHSFTHTKEKEDLNKRSQYAKHFLDENGNYTALVTAGSSLNYLDKDTKKWETIETNLEVNSTGKYPNHSWVNTKNQFISFYPANATQGIITEYNEGNIVEGLNKTMVWMDENYNILSSVNFTPATAIVTGNKIMYPNVISDIDLTYYQQNDGRKMDYILNNPTTVNQAPANAKYLAFGESFNLPTGASTSFIKNEIGNIIQINAIIKEKNIFRYELPKHYDSSNKIIESHYIVNQNTIYTVVSKDWLNSGLSFPVVIDPTITVYPTSNENYNTGCIDSQANKHAGADINVGVREAYGSLPGATTRRFFRAWASFDVTSIPDDATINNVIFGCHILINNLYEPEGQKIVIAPITSGVPNLLTGGALYNAINENSANGIFSINPLTGNLTTPLNATLDITSLAIPSVTSSLVNNIYSLGFVAQGNYDPAGYSEFVSIYGSSQPTQVTNGKPYLTITYTPNMGLNNIEKNIGIYPNPVQSELFIKSDENIKTVEIFSMLGQKVATVNSKNNILVSHLTNGIYAIQITLENGAVINQKFIKN